MKKIKASMFASYNKKEKLENLELEQVSYLHLYRIKNDSDDCKRIAKYSSFSYQQHYLLLNETVPDHISYSDYTYKTIYDMIRGDDGYQYFYLHSR